MIFILGGILPFLWITWLGVRYGIKVTTHVVPPETLFVEEHPEAEEDRTGFPVAAGVGSRPGSRGGDRYRRREDGGREGGEAGGREGGQEGGEP